MDWKDMKKIKLDVEPLNKFLYIYLGVLLVIVLSYFQTILGKNFEYWSTKISIILIFVSGALILILKFDITKKYLNDYISEVQLGFALLLTAMGIYNDFLKTDTGISLFFIALSASGFFILYSGIIRKRYSTLEQTITKNNETITHLAEALENNELRKRDEVKHYIRNLAENRLGFYPRPKYEDRISLYLHLDFQNAFILYYRFSKNPDLQKTGRRTYPDDLGAIREAWLHGKVSRSYGNRYDEDPEAYIKEVHEMDGLSEELIASLTMKPQQLIACRLDKGQDIFYGLLVIESNREERFKPEDVYQIVNTCGHSKEELYDKIGDLRTIVPDMMESSKEMGLENDS